MTSRVRCRRSSSRLLASLLVASTLVFGCSERQRTLDDANEKIEAGRADEALSGLREALADLPDDSALNLAYGRALFASGQPSLAVWSLTKASRDPALFAEATLLLAQAQIATHGEELAVATLQTLLDAEPDHLDALRLMVEACIEARQLDKALETVEHALDLLPDDLALQMSRMRVFLHLDRQEEAAEVLAGIRSRIPDLDDLDPEQRALLAGRYCAIEATFTHESGRTDEARTLFEQCLIDHPDHPQVLASASGFFDAVGEPERATEIQRKALEMDPENLERRVSLSIRLRRVGEAAEAEKLLKAVTGTQPGVFTALVDHYVDVDDQEKALDALDHAFAQAGDDVPADWKTVRADLLIQTGRLDEAERAIEEIPEEVYALTARGRLELARGHAAKALELLERGIRLWPDGTMARYLAAQAAEQLGDFDRAETEYREAYRADQTYTDAGLQLAGLLASRGLPGEALTLSNAYLQANPDDGPGFEQAIGFAVAARDGEMARTLLYHYQRQPGLDVSSAAFAVRQLLRTKQAKEAVALVESLRFDPARPDHFELLKVRCEAWTAVGRARDSLALVRRLRGAEPERLDLAELEASVLEASGARDEAKAILARILEKDPRRATALRALAALAAASGEQLRAIELFLQAADADPEDADSLVEAALRTPPGAERESRLRAALRRRPRDGRAAAELADSLVVDAEKPPAEATALLERARRFGAAVRADEIAKRLARDGRA
ncbi:MAG: tetratricopeptide repeat protein [Deltaproteobacteria bacterium]|nr:tetratricopeptide repeat protein [Deltaproteobacteria bacterium]